MLLFWYKQSWGHSCNDPVPVDLAVGVKFYAVLGGVSLLLIAWGALNGECQRGCPALLVGQSASLWRRGLLNLTFLSWCHSSCSRRELNFILFWYVWFFFFFSFWKCPNNFLFYIINWLVSLVSVQIRKWQIENIFFIFIFLLTFLNSSSSSSVWSFFVIFGICKNFNMTINSVFI